MEYDVFRRCLCDECLSLIDVSKTLLPSHQGCTAFRFQVQCDQGVIKTIFRDGNRGKFVWTISRMWENASLSRITVLYP